MNTFSNTPHLVAVREANEDDGTDLHEFWVLKQYAWFDGDESYEDPPVQLYIAPWTGTHNTARDGLPISDDRAAGSCKWSETPRDIRATFEQEARALREAVVGFKGVDV